MRETRNHPQIGRLSGISRILIERFEKSMLATTGSGRDRIQLIQANRPDCYVRIHVRRVRAKQYQGHNIRSSWSEAPSETLYGILRSTGFENLRTIHGSIGLQFVDVQHRFTATRSPTPGTISSYPLIGKDRDCLTVVLLGSVGNPRSNN